MEGKQLQVLELAAHIQYFTLDHLYQAGIYTSPSRSTAREHLRDLKAYGWLSESHFGVSRGFGRLPTIYGLTPKAARYLAEYENFDSDKIKLSHSNKNQEYETRAPADYFHRIGLLDSVLALLLMLDKKDIREDFLELYFRRYGMHQPRRTAIELEGGRIEPDAIISFQGQDKKRLYLVEFYEDSTQLERVKRGLLRHAEAISSGAPSTAFGVSVGHRVLLIFRHEHTARAIMEWVKYTPELAGVADRFLFKTLESAVSDPFDHWGTAGAGRVNIF
jgi:Replication-relaxation